MSLTDQIECINHQYFKSVEHLSQINHKKCTSFAKAFEKQIQSHLRSDLFLAQNGVVWFPIEKGCYREVETVLTENGVKSSGTNVNTVSTECISLNMLQNQMYVHPNVFDAATCAKLNLK